MTDQELELELNGRTRLGDPRLGRRLALGILDHFIPAYGAPLTYHPIYPHGGLYSHPNIAVVSFIVPEIDGKGPEKEERVIMKKSKGDLGDTCLGGKSRENVSGFEMMRPRESWLHFASQSSGSEDASNSRANGQNGILAIESSPNAMRQSATNLNHASCRKARIKFKH
ncbi:hypothetical protein Syun_026191 [Stephania yunnanensis]|uniref:G-box binding protein multifunctional mosaic region domain-containing protein n=1 Tax=Stephania yunnanensis TaxID=152371 RepID=A0AAP0ETU3_9MAGN